MDFDFPTILVVLTAITGLFWVYDKLQTKKLNASTSSSSSSLTPEQLKELSIVKDDGFSLVKTLAEAFPVILIVLILRSFVIEPFRIPSGSMLPTLEVGDFIVVNKYAYGLRLPITNTKFFAIGEPKRGDVMVFNHPVEGRYYIKRIVGIPGDVIQYKNKQLFINGQAADYIKGEIYFDEGRAVRMFDEHWPAGKQATSEDGFTHKVLFNDKIRPARTQEWVVPAGHYFGLGDNRDNSNDSRYWGFIPDTHVVGKAFGIWMNWNSKDNGPVPIKWQRIGNGID